MLFWGGKKTLHLCPISPVQLIPRSSSPLCNAIFPPPVILTGRATQELVSVMACEELSLFLCVCVCIKKVEGKSTTTTTHPSHLTAHCIIPLSPFSERLLHKRQGRATGRVERLETQHGKIQVIQCRFILGWQILFSQALCQTECKKKVVYSFLFNILRNGQIRSNTLSSANYFSGFEDLREAIGPSPPNVYHTHLHQWVCSL